MSHDHRAAAAHYHRLHADTGLDAYAARAAHHEDRAASEVSQPGAMSIMAVTTILQKEDERRRIRAARLTGARLQIAAILELAGISSPRLARELDAAAAGLAKVDPVTGEPMP